MGPWNEYINYFIYYVIEYLVCLIEHKFVNHLRHFIFFFSQMSKMRLNGLQHLITQLYGGFLHQTS